MKFAISNEVLKDVIERVAVTIGKQPVYPPFVKLWTNDENHVTVTAENSHTFCDVTIPASIEEFGAVYLDIDTVKKIYNIPGMVTISKNGNNLVARGAKKGCEIATLIFDEPYVHPDHNTESTLALTMPNDKLLSAIDRLLPAVDSCDGVRPVLQGIYFDCNDGNMVALDGFRMHIVDMNQNGADISDFTGFNLYGNRLAHLKKLIRKSDMPLTMEISRHKSAVSFHYETPEYALTYGISVIEGDYIKYKQILPQKFLHEFTANPDELKRIAKEYKGYKVGNLMHFVYLKDGMFTYIKGDSFRTYDKVESYNGITAEPCDLIIKFNALYVLEGMGVLENKETWFGWNNAVKPMLVKQDDMTVLILPVRDDAFMNAEVKEFIEKN